MPPPDILPPSISIRIPQSQIRNPMQTYDMLMILVLVAATLFGFWKGMAWQIASLASLVVSYFVAKEFADQLAPMISNHAPWNKFVAMFAIYIATSFVIWTLFRLVSGLIDRVKLDGFDRQMGALIGLAKGGLLCIVITFFAVTILPQNQKDTIIASNAGQYIIRFLDKTHSVVPPEIHEVIHPYVERIEKRLDPNYQPNPAGDLQNLWPSEAAASSWPSQSQPTQSQPNSGWPQQPPATEQPSVYQRQQPNSAQPSWPQSQPAEQQPAWPSGNSQTADRPTGGPL